MTLMQDSSAVDVSENEKNDPAVVDHPAVTTDRNSHPDHENETNPVGNNTNNNNSSMITLISNDDHTFQVPFEVCKLSGFLVDTLGLDDQEENDETTTTTSPTHHHAQQPPSSYEPIMIPRVNGEILQLIIDFLLHYHYVKPMPAVPQPIVGDTFHEVMTDAWYQQYITTATTTTAMATTRNECTNPDYPEENDNHHHKNTIFSLLEAANFMEISPLIDLTCLWCTFQISGRSTEDIRLFLNLPALTGDELAQARAEHPWIFDGL